MALPGFCLGEWAAVLLPFSFVPSGWLSLGALVAAPRLLALSSRVFAPQTPGWGWKNVNNIIHSIAGKKSTEKNSASNLDTVSYWFEAACMKCNWAPLLCSGPLSNAGECPPLSLICHGKRGWREKALPNWHGRK